MERKLLLVFALTFLVIMLFQPILKKYGPQPAATPQTSKEQPVSNPPQTAGGTTAAENAAPGSGVSAASSRKAPAAAAKQAAAESETVIDNGLYHIVFTNRGGQVKSWVLKNYKDTPNGNPLDLVNATAAAKYGYPLSLWTYEETLRNKLNSALYVATSTSATAPAEITFEYSDAEVSVQKKFKFDHSYVVGVQTSVQQKGAHVAAFPMWPAGFGGESTAPSFAAAQIAYQNDSKVERLAIKKISGGGTIQGPFQWAGESEQIFRSRVPAQDSQTATMVTLHNQIEIPRYGSDPNAHQVDRVDVLGAAVGSLHGDTNERLYVGPKALVDLEAVSVPGIAGAEPDLRAVVDFGWLGIIARPLFLWLKWTYNHIVANWGWAILFQTLIINLAIFRCDYADEVHAQDAARGAADQVDPGKIQEVQPARPAQS